MTKMAGSMKRLQWGMEARERTKKEKEKNMNTKNGHEERKRDVMRETKGRES